MAQNKLLGIWQGLLSGSLWTFFDRSLSTCVWPVDSGQVLGVWKSLGERCALSADVFGGMMKGSAWDSGVTSGHTHTVG